MNIAERNAVLVLAQRALQECKSVSLHSSQVIELVEIIEALQSGDVKMGYAGRCRGCGHIVAAAVDQPSQPQITVEDVADFVKAGYIVQFLPLSQINNELRGCTCKEGEDEAA